MIASEARQGQVAGNSRAAVLLGDDMVNFKMCGGE
jgi:hypothetical protein